MMTMRAKRHQFLIERAYIYRTFPEEECQNRCAQCDDHIKIQDNRHRYVVKKLAQTSTQIVEGRKITTNVETGDIVNNIPDLRISTGRKEKAKVKKNFLSKIANSSDLHPVEAVTASNEQSDDPLIFIDEEKDCLTEATGKLVVVAWARLNAQSEASSTITKDAEALGKSKCAISPLLTKTNAKLVCPIEPLRVLKGHKKDTAEVDKKYNLRARKGKR